MDIESFIEPIILSMKITFFASCVAFLLGGIAAWVMTSREIRGKTVIETVFMLPLVLPPTVIGLFLLILLGKENWVGGLLFRLTESSILFTWWAGVCAAAVVSFPLVYNTLKIGFVGVDRELHEAGRSLGANEWQLIRYVALPLMIPSLITAFILAFARGLGEFGATIMVAGNIPGKTQTVASAIYTAVESGDMRLAVWWSLSIVLLSYCLLFLTYKK